MVVTVGQTSSISGLHIVYTILSIPGKGLVELTLVVDHVASRLVVTDEAHPFLTGILRNLLHVKVSKGLGVIKELRTSPVFPTGIPSLKKNRFYAVACGKVDVLDGVLGSGAVSVTHHPALNAEVHAPPYAYILHRADPVGRIKGTGLIKIED